MNEDIPAAKPVSKARGRKRFWSVTALVVTAGIGAAVFFGQDTEVPQAATMPAPTAVERVITLHSAEVTTVALQDVDDRLKVTGSIYPSQEAAIAAQVSGLAEAVLVQSGEAVHEGELLVEVGTSDLQLQLEQQKATVASTMVQLEAAEATFARTETLVAKSLAAANTLDTAKAEVDQLRATVATQQTQVDLAEKNLERAHVQAPFSGTVASRTIEPGQVISPGTTMLTLVDLSSVRVEVMVRLADIAQVEPGQEVHLRVQGIEDAVFAGKVDRINPVAEEGTRSVKVFLTIDNPEGKLRGGMFVTGDIVVRQKPDILAIPATAVQSREDEHFVVAVDDGLLQERPIQVGDAWEDGSLIEARSGLTAGDVIVSSAMTGLTIGFPVTVEGN